MTATPLAIPGLILIEPRVVGDDRGFFFKSFNQANFDAAIAIRWPIDGAPAPSAKDRQGHLIASAERFA
jgi:dTDP-4-dehydrorhamnose 3,5-epimerase-like enzyme